MSAFDHSGQEQRELTARSYLRGTCSHVAMTIGIAFCLLVTSSPVIADESRPSESKWRIRGRVIGIIPDDSSNDISLHAGPATVPLSAGVGVDSAVVPELDVTYMITPHFGVEVIAGIANHDVEIDGSDPVLGGLGVPNGTKIFDVWVLPPTVTLQYHFRPDAKIRPYAGVGANYTAFLWNDATKNLETTLGSPVSVDTSSSWGWAAQFGLDWDLNGRWFANIDVKYIDIDTTASLHVKTLGAGLRVDLDVDPWVVGAGIGYRF